MFVSGFNINLQVAVSIQLSKELCNRASNDSCEKYTVQAYQLKLDIKSNATWQTSKLCLKECSTLLSVLHSGLLGSYAHMTWCRLSLIVGVIIALSNPILLWSVGSILKYKKINNIFYCAIHSGKFIKCYLKNTMQLLSAF